MTCKCVLNELTAEQIREIRREIGRPYKACKQCGKSFPAQGNKIFCSSACRVSYHITLDAVREASKDREIEALLQENRLLKDEIRELKKALMERGQP